MKHGMLFGADDGSLWRVFSPPWYRVDRWLWFFFVREDRARLTIGGRPHFVTAAGSKVALAHVARRPRTF